MEEQPKDEWVNAAEEVLKAGQVVSQTREGVAPMARLVASYYLSLLEAKVEREDARNLAADFLRLMWVQAVNQ